MLLGNAKRKSLFRFTDVVSRILAEQHDPSMIDKWEEDKFRSSHHGYGKGLSNITSGIV